MASFRTTSALALLSALAIASTTLVAGHAPSAAAASAPEVDGLPAEVPPAALADENALPPAGGWPHSDAFSRTSGTGRMHDGALLWTDFLYDDTGAGDYTYAAPDAGANGADIFRAGVALDSENSYWRVDWNTLIDPDVPIAAWAFDTDGDVSTGASEWPAEAGVRSPGIDQVVVVSSRGAWLVDPVTLASIDLLAQGAEVAVDAGARSFVLSVPRSVLDVQGAWDVRLVAGVADATGTAFEAPPEATAGETRVYNAAFRSRDDEPFLVGGWTGMGTNWNNGAQSAALAANDVSAFSVEVDWQALEAGASTPEPLPTGYSTRWYVSSVETGQGLDPAARGVLGPALVGPLFYGRVQPYTVYVPTGYDPAVATPLTLLLHAGDRNHNGFGGATQDDVYGPMCEQRDSICVTPLARGNTTWYLNEAELDVWEVWNRVAHTYTLDSERTVVGGWSMGAVGSTRFVTNHPDLFAGSVLVSGAGYYSTQGQRDQAGDELRAENLRNTVTFIDSGSADVALTATRRWDAAFEAAGIRYRANYYDGADHGLLGTSLGWSDAAAYIESQTDARALSPASLALRWQPGDERPDLGITVDRAYWMTGLSECDPAARWSRVAATSSAISTPVVSPVLDDATVVIDGRDVQVRDQSWSLAPAAPTANEVTVDLQNVSAATLDLAGAGVDASAPASITVTTDCATTVTLAAAGESRVVQLAPGTHVLSMFDAATPDGAPILPVTGGEIAGLAALALLLAGGGIGALGWRRRTSTRRA